MTGAQMLFWLFAGTACAGAVAVVISQNVVRMAVYLIVALGSAAGLFFLASADFVGATQLLVYVGGTIVLLIFGVMLTASGPYLRIRTSPAEGFLAGGVGLLFLTMLAATVLGIDWDSLAVWDSRSLHRAGEGVVTQEAWDSMPDDAVIPGNGLNPKESFVRVEQGDTVIYRLRPGLKLSRKEARELTGYFHRNVASASSAQREIGDTVRPVGLAFAGLRPDRDADTLGQDAVPPRTISTGYLLPFEIVSVHLLVVLIGAAYLARAKRRASATE